MSDLPKLISFDNLLSNEIERSKEIQRERNLLRRETERLRRVSNNLSYLLERSQKQLLEEIVKRDKVSV